MRKAASIERANRLYRWGAYREALALYEEIATRPGWAPLVQANIALCRKRLAAGASRDEEARAAPPSRKVLGDAREPLVSIVMPVFNDAQWVSTALDSCLAQSLGAIEVICVDDASTDETAAIIEDYQRRDPRVRLIRQPKNLSAFQARRVGIFAAKAPYVLFLDGDDELEPDAALVAWEVATAKHADVVAFGSRVIAPDGSTPGGFQSALQPAHAELFGEEILHALFAVGKPIQGQLWRYLFDRHLLERAYSALPADLVLPRANDVPIAFTALMLAQTYASTDASLYRYYLRRGASGHRIRTLDEFRFIFSAIDSIEAIEPAVRAESSRRAEPEKLLATYASARLSVIGRVLVYVCDIYDDDLRAECFALLCSRVGRAALLEASADFCPRALTLLAETAEPTRLAERDTRHVMIRASNLQTGGAQGVVVSQARYLARAGFKVTVAVDVIKDVVFELPEGVELVHLAGDSRAQRLETFRTVCRERNVDLVIDHYVLYTDHWPFFALMALEDGIPTIGWLHNFALRPIVDRAARTSFLEKYLPLLSAVVVLSGTDVAFWKLRGLTNVVWLPNPPSPLLSYIDIREDGRTAPAGTLEIVWWGRLQQATKRVKELVEIGAVLRELGVAFRLTIIGPDSRDLKASQLRELAAARGIDDALVTPGPLHGDDLIRAIEHAHVFVNTSIIEGYPLVLTEANALGLPVVMYELPWLMTVRDNAGVIAVKQGDRYAFAKALAKVAADEAYYTALSRGALAAARKALTHDFTALYTDLVRGRLSPAFSPEPHAADMRGLIDQFVLFTERSIREQQRRGARATR